MDQLVAMGFSASDAERALNKCAGDPQRAADWLMEVHSESGHSSNSSVSSADVERSDGEPGIIKSEAQPEAGPILTLLMATAQVQMALNVDVDLEWRDNWWSSYADEPQSLLAELVRLAAFVHMGCGRLHADAHLLAVSIGMNAFEDLDHFLGSLEPLKKLFAMTLDGEHLSHLMLENCMGDLNALLDNHMLGKSAAFGPLIVAQLECQGPVMVQETWYPQRCTNELAEVTSLFKHVMIDMDIAYSNIRRQRLGLRAFRGTDVVEMLASAAATMRERNHADSAAKLDQLAQDLGHQRNDLMDKQHDIDTSRKRLEVAYRTFDAELFKTLKLEPVAVKPYHLVGVMVTASEYYTLFEGHWFYVRNDYPSQSTFRTVQEASRDAANLLAIYSVDTEREELKPSEAIRQFCLRELESMEQQTRSTTPETNSDSSVLMDVDA